MRNLLTCCLVLMNGIYGSIRLERSLNLPTECGLVLSDDRITNGENATLGQFPFMALLGYTKHILGINLTHFSCGGSIINNYYILTSAHCIDESLNLVRLGELNLQKDIDCVENFGTVLCGDPYIDIAIKKEIVHKNYDSETFKNDIAIIKVAQKINFTEFIQPICLPVALRLDLENSQLLVSGWGKIKNDEVGGFSMLQYAAIDIWQKNNCENALALKVRPLNDEIQLCGNGKKGQDACSGDSGGPLFATKAIDFKIKRFQVGIVSFGSGSCGNSELPTVYTRVDNYINWIIENIK